MSVNDPFIVIPKASIRPNKIVFYNQILKRYTQDQIDKKTLSPEVKKDLQKMGVPVKVQPSFNTHNFVLSDKAKTRIKQKVTWLYSLAKTASVTASSGKTLYAFKMNFITLTLPSKQLHETSEITNICLNQFLTECKSRFNMQNYIWRLEFQKNGNAHYHIATDCYMEYFKARAIWNRCLQKLGYVDNYASQFKGMTLAQYCQKFNNNGKNDFQKLKSRFTHGCATRWQNPNTVDVKSVGNAKQIAFYISKYITKNEPIISNTIVTEREPKDTNLRMWFCSRSLSRLDKIEYFLEEVNDVADRVFKTLKNVKKLMYDYVTVWYFDTKEQIFDTKACLWQLYNDYAKECNYVPWRPTRG